MMVCKKLVVLYFLLLAQMMVAELPSLVEAVILRDVSQVRQLLASGINVNQADSGGVTALMRACYISAEITEVLLKAGADVRLKDENGSTALDWAVPAPESSAKIDLKILKMLLSAGADPDGGYGGVRTLWNACGKGPLEAVQLLVEAGANVMARSLVGDPSAGTIEVGIAGAAQFYGRTEILKYLVESGYLKAKLIDSDVNVRDKPSLAGSSIIAVLGKNETVTVLGRAKETITIGGLTGSWLKIKLPDNRIGYSFSEFYQIDAFWALDIPFY